MKRHPSATMLAATLLLGWVLGGASIGSPAAAAEPYPVRTIRIVVGFGPGSTADTVARLVARQLEATLGHPVVVENRPGNSSMIAAEFVGRAPHDGYTLFMATVANTVNPASTKSRFNLGTDLAPIALLAVVPNMLVANPAVPANNLQDLVALAKSKPESLAFGTSGAATATHLAAELFNIKAGTNILAVHYPGGSNQALTDLLAGRITLMFSVAATLAPHVKQGTLRALAMAQPRRASIMPDVPTMDEQGMPGFDAGVWIGLLAPAGTSPEIIKTLSAGCNEALKVNEVASALTAQGIDPLGGTPEEFADFIRRDIDKWVAVLSATGLGN
jgi:tripartite-type tricarboxylate transporter receptor subunit TctC